MVCLNPLYGRLDRFAFRQIDLHYARVVHFQEARKEHAKILFFKMPYISIKKDQNRKILSLYNKMTSV